MSVSVHSSATFPTGRILLAVSIMVSLLPPCSQLDPLYHTHTHSLLIDVFSLTPFLKRVPTDET